MNKPQILLLGDSIRMGYCQIVKELLKDEYEVIFPESNCRCTHFTLESLEFWVNLCDPDRVAAVHFNNGQWDAARFGGPEGAWRRVLEDGLTNTLIIAFLGLAIGIVLGAEIIDIGVVLGVVFPAALTAAELGIIDLGELAVDLPGVEESDGCIVKLLVLQRALQEVVTLFFTACSKGQLGHTPVVVGLFNGDGHTLTVFKVMDPVAVFLLVLFQAGEVAVFVVALGQLVRLAVLPGQHGALGGILVGGFIGQIQIKLHALGHGLG